MCTFVLMILAFVLSSVEMYVLLALLAAAVLALCMKPSKRGEAVTHMYAGTLCSLEELPIDKPYIDFQCLESGNVLLTRRGLQNLTDSGAVSLVVKVIGFDVTIEERVVYGRGEGESVNTALFTLDFMAAERYFIRYISEPTSTAASLTLNNRPDMHISRPLQLNS